MRYTVLLVLAVLAACTPMPAEPPVDDPAQQAPASFSYADGVLSWQAQVEKPTPCHTVSVDERVMESFPVQVVVELSVQPPEDPSQLCAQVIDTETVSGELQVDSPGSVEIIVADQGTVTGNI